MHTLRSIAGVVRMLEPFVRDLEIKAEHPERHREWANKLRHLREEYQKGILHTDVDVGFDSQFMDWKPDEGPIQRWIHEMPLPEQVADYDAKVLAEYREIRAELYNPPPWWGLGRIPANSSYQIAWKKVLQRERACLMRLDNADFAAWILEHGEVGKDHDSNYVMASDDPLVQ